MKKIILIAMIFSSFVFSKLQAQDQKLSRGNKQYDNFAFIDAIETYERIAAKGYKSPELFQRLGNANYFNGNYTQAQKWYTELFALNQPVEAEYYYRYAQTLKSANDFKKADEYMEKFNTMNVNDERARLFSVDKNYLQQIRKNSGRYSIENATVNSSASDYGTSFFKGKMVFASSRPSEGVSMKIDKWNNEPFATLYASVVKTDGTLETPERFLNELGIKYHVATPAFSKDGLTIYFSQNRKALKGDKDPKAKMIQIYKATFVNGKWRDAEPVSFNGDYNVSHPALSFDEKTMYFASDMPGSKGQSDLYKVSINTDGSFGTPENLGSTINTEGKETMPFIAEDNTLYFASDGHPGLGGLDIFKAMPEGKGFGKPMNVGEPVNSTQDDFAFMIDSPTATGFFSSNRSGGKGMDDIYKFKETKKLDNIKTLSGTLSTPDGELLENVKISLYDKDFKLIKEVYTDRMGGYSFDVKDGQKYYVRAEKKDYETIELPTTMDGSSKNSQTVLTKKVQQVAVKESVEKAFGIRDISFDLNKAILKNDAIIDLQKIIDVMKQNPGMLIDIKAYTDSRGTSEYNQNLSETRAQVTMDYMIKNGIHKNRLTARGYGETELLNNCSDGVECSEKQHEANRRSKFVIVRVK